MKANSLDQEYLFDSIIKLNNEPQEDNNKAENNNTGKNNNIIKTIDDIQILNNMEIRGSTRTSSTGRDRLRFR